MIHFILVGAGDVISFTRSTKGLFSTRTISSSGMSCQTSWTISYKDFIDRTIKHLTDLRPAPTLTIITQNVLVREHLGVEFTLESVHGLEYYRKKNCNG